MITTYQESGHIKDHSAYNILIEQTLACLSFCGIIKLEDSGIDQLSVALKQWTGSVSADCGARPWVKR